MRKLNKVFVHYHQLFLKVLVNKGIPINDLHLCVLTKVLDNMDEELVAFQANKSVTKCVQYSITCRQLLIFQQKTS